MPKEVVFANTAEARPVVGVGVVVLKGDAVLLVRRRNPPRAGEWSIPGGRQELGESVRAAALRELVEETGVSVELGPIIDVVDAIARDGSGRVERHYTLIDFAASWRAGEPRAGGDAAEARFFPLADALRAVAWEETRRAIRVAAAKGRGRR